MKKSIFIYAFLGLVFLAQAVSAQTRYAWNGEWNVPSLYSPATLTIKTRSAKSFDFKIEALNGANTGEISGTAMIAGSRAFFDDRKSKEKDFEPYGCKLTFTHRGTFIDVDMNNECMSYGGNGVFFANKYYRGKPKVRESDFVYLEVFPTAALDAKFKQLVGRDYELFLDSFQMISEEEDLDDLGVKAFSACVRGICPFTAGIIMYNAKGEIWAAVLDAGADDKIFADYYTNSPPWTEKLPKTIEKWITEKSRLNDKLTVVFKNKR